MVDMLSNDFDADGNPLMVTSISGPGPSHGNATIQSGSGPVLYMPEANFCGTDAFDYEVLDGQAARVLPW